MKTKKKIPMKMRTIEWLKDHPNSCVEEVMAGLKSEYGNEGQFNRKNFEHTIAAMKAVGIIRNTCVEFDSANEVAVRYTLTDYGVSSMKHIPKA